MCLFPCVVQTRSTSGRGETVVFRSITLEQKRNVTYIPLPDGGRRPGSVACYVDQKLTTDQQTFAAIISSVSFCSYSVTSPIYISTDHDNASEKIEGASLGLAVAIEIAYPGMFPNVAFTGFIGLFSSDDMTAFVQPVLGTRAKIIGAVLQGVPLIVPADRNTHYPETIPYLSGNNFTAYTSPTSPISHRQPFPLISIATTFLEAYQMALWQQTANRTPN